MIGKWTRKKHPHNQQSFFIKVNDGRGVRSHTLSLYSYRTKDVEGLASVTATTTFKHSRLWLSEAVPPQCPCFPKTFSLKSSSDLDLPQHSVDLPAHHASPGSPALWTHGLDSVHWTTGWGEKGSSVSKILALHKPSVTFVLQRSSRFCRFLKLLKIPFVNRHKTSKALCQFS